MPATTPSKWCFDSGSGPKRSELSSAIGRAPIVNTSRRMPPTPVAAPWYGSINDGWLWLSILKTTASPSPMSTTPAFSPGPQMTRGPSVGSVFSHTFDDLYEQCSLHIAEKTPSSVRLGVRPRIVSQRANSSVDNPISAASAGVTLLLISVIASAAKQSYAGCAF